MKLIWKKCPCAHPLCKRQYPENLGHFTVGTGFDPHEVEILDEAFAALARSQAIRLIFQKKAAA